MADTDSTTLAPSSSAPEPSGSAPAPAPDSAAPSDASAAPSPADSPASPSDASPTSEREALLAAVRSVVPTQPEPSLAEPDEAPEATGDNTGQSDPDKPPDATAQPAAQPQDPDPTEADLRRLKPETRKRFERLLGQRDDARRALEGAQPELAQHRQLQGYLAQHQLAPDDVNALLGVGAALRRKDFQAFLNGVAPYVVAAQEALGQRIAPDLQRQVDDGLVSEDAARQMTQLRHRAQAAEADNTSIQQQQQQETIDRTVVAVRNAVEAWEQGIKSRDPDYPKKADAVRRYSQALLSERGPPRTPQQAMELAQAAYDEVTRTFAAGRPAPAPTRMSPSGINGATGAVPQPRTMKEAAIMALRQMHRAS